METQQLASREVKTAVDLVPTLSPMDTDVPSGVSMATAFPPLNTLPFKRRTAVDLDERNESPACEEGNYPMSSVFAFNIQPAF